MAEFRLIAAQNPENQAFLANSEFA